MAKQDKWWLRERNVRSASSAKQLGTILHVLPSGSALVQWNNVREPRYVCVTDLVPVPSERKP